MVRRLAVTPVKGTRLHAVEQIELERSGARSNRRFFIVDQRNRMVNGKRLGELNRLVADYSEAERTLRITFPDAVVQGPVSVDSEPISTSFFSGTVAARVVEGPWSAALSEFLGQPLRLVEAEGAVDRGALGAVSLISQASLSRLAEAAGEPDVDSRRFRMLLEIDGVAAHAEDQWVGRRARIGEAQVKFAGHVGRCLITSRHPESGKIDLPTLDVLASYRDEARTTEPLPFGIYGHVLQPSRIRVGDRIRVE